MYSAVSCPECGHPATVVDEFTLESTDGPVEHVRVRCVGQHRFMMPADGLTRLSAALTSVAS